ncbi:MAG: RrF2 family transcriptional regulator [Anaerolineae bacterium]
MRITRGADYGTRGMIYLAAMPKESVILVSEIASAVNLPASYMAKIFQELAKEGIVQSHRGARGGFSMARPATQITLRQIIEAIEGPISLNRCLSASEGCENSGTCPVHPVLARAQGQLVDVLDQTTLHDLACAGTLEAYAS